MANDLNKTEPIDGLILFYDVYIVSGDGYDHPDRHNAAYITNSRIAMEKKARSSSHTFRFQNKLDVCKYVIASYAELDWDLVVIRFECENPADNSHFHKFCRKIFPSAEIENSRSDTAQKYLHALSKLKRFGNPWIFFSPNNDHPYIGKEKSLSHYIKLAQEFEKKYPNHVITILYSHFTEAMCRISPSQHLWGRYGKAFTKIKYEDQDSYVMEINKFLCDSIHILRLDILLEIFSTTKNTGRLIKLEDTEFYFSQKIKHLSVWPKKELCRHYDGSLGSEGVYERFNHVPLLFIPDGFFERNIKIRYGFPDYKEGFINIDPTASSSRYLTGTGPDINCLLDDIPGCWLSRISSIERNPGFSDANLDRANLEYYKNLVNPWYQRPRIANLCSSVWRYWIALPLSLIWRFIKYNILRRKRR